MALSAELRRLIAEFASRYANPDRVLDVFSAMASAFQSSWSQSAQTTRPDVMDAAAFAYIRQHGAELVTQISETSRNQLRGIIRKGVEKGWTYHEMQEKLIDDWGGSAKRSLMIARTELAFALNTGEASEWEADGVKYVKIVDGTQIDEICRAANGKTVTVAEYRRRPIAHPNCQRYAVPLPFDEKPSEIGKLEDE